MVEKLLAPAAGRRGRIDMIVEEIEALLPCGEARAGKNHGLPRHVGSRAVYQAAREVAPITLEELDRIVGIWADSCLQLRDRDLKVMQRLVSAQDKLQGTLQAAE